MSDVLFLGGSAFWFGFGLVALVGGGHFLIEEWRKSHARHLADKAKARARAESEIISAFMDLARERLTKGRRA